MFGSKKRLERRLAEGGAAAPAEVIGASPTTTRIGNAHPRLVWKLRIRVCPAGDVPFEADIRHPVPWDQPPTVGMTLPVLYDPADHSKVAVDQRDDPPRRTPLFPDLGAVAGNIAKAVEAAPLTQDAAQMQQEAAQAGGPVPRTFKLGPDGRLTAQPPEADLLRQLIYLRNHDQISDAEYQARRRQILGE
jgi:hypothetical protein